MPFLRQDADSTLAETLGNLGGALSQSLNPMNQMRAQDMLAQMRQRQWELQHQQTLDAANRDAADKFVRSMDPNDPNTAIFGAQIRAGNNPTEAIIAAGKYGTAQKAAATVANDPTMSKWPLAAQQGAANEILNGGDYGSIMEKYANGTLATVKTGAAVNAGDAAAKAASAPGMDPEAAALARSQALTDPAAAEKLIAGQRVLTGGRAITPETDQFSPIITEFNTRQQAAGMTPSLPAQTMPQKIAGDVAADVAKRSLGPGAPDQVIRGGTFDPKTNTFVPAAPAVPGQPPAAPASGTAGTVSVGAAPPDTAASAATEGTKTQAHEVAMGDIKVLDEAISESGAAQSMKSKLAQLKDLTDALDTSGLGLTSRVLRTLADYNVHPGDVGATYGAIQQIINAEIPDVRQKAGIQRLAGPAIKEEQLILGTANMPKSTLMNIIANEEATADLQISRAMLAYRARTGQIPMNDYYKQSLALDATIKEHTDELRKAYKAIGTERTRPADVPANPNPNPNPNPDTTTNGGNSPALRFDKNTRSLVPVK
jgi:hypothetical protein